MERRIGDQEKTNERRQFLQLLPWGNLFRELAVFDEHDRKLGRAPRASRPATKRCVSPWCFEIWQAPRSPPSRTGCSRVSRRLRESDLGVRQREVRIRPLLFQDRPVSFCLRLPLGDQCPILVGRGSRLRTRCPQRLPWSMRWRSCSLPHSTKHPGEDSIGPVDDRLFVKTCDRFVDEFTDTLPLKFGQRLIIHWRLQYGKRRVWHRISIQT